MQNKKKNILFAVKQHKNVSTKNVTQNYCLLQTLVLNCFKTRKYNFYSEDSAWWIQSVISVCLAVSYKNCGLQKEKCREFREYSIEFHEISYNIPMNVIILTFQAMFTKITGNVPRDSMGSLKRFWGMLLKTPGNVQKGYVEFLKRFQRMLQKILGMFEQIPGTDNNDSRECC